MSALAIAAIAVGEALMISLVDKGLLDWHEVSEALESARDAHENAEPSHFTRKEHQEAAKIITALLRRSNSLRPSSRL